MEEIKNILPTEEPEVLNNEVKESLPDMGTQVQTEDVVGTEIVPLQGRVSNAFMGSIIVTPDKLKRDFNLTLSDPEIMEA